MALMSQSALEFSALVDHEVHLIHSRAQRFTLFTMRSKQISTSLSAKLWKRHEIPRRDNKHWLRCGGSWCFLVDTSKERPVSTTAVLKNLGRDLRRKMVDAILLVLFVAQCLFSAFHYVLGILYGLLLEWFCEPTGTDADLNIVRIVILVFLLLTKKLRKEWFLPLLQMASSLPQFNPLFLHSIFPSRISTSRVVAMRRRIDTVVSAKVRQGRRYNHFSWWPKDRCRSSWHDDWHIVPWGSSSSIKKPLRLTAFTRLRVKLRRMIANVIVLMLFVILKVFDSLWMHTLEILLDLTEDWLP